MSKAAKFQMMEHTQDLYQHMAQDVNDRMSRAVEELQDKHAVGAAHNESSESEPTGEAYRLMEEQQRREEAARKRSEAAARRQRADEEQQATRTKREDAMLDEDREEDDHEIRLLRERRLRELRAQQAELTQSLARGHGEFTEVSQDEFLPVVTSSKRVICHFYHSDFPRCHIMDHHLAALAPRHVEARFIKVNADRAPFFVSKLTIRVLPTVVTFIEGVATDRIVGFEGLTEGLAAGKEDEWPTVALAIRLAAAKIIDKERIEGVKEARGRTLEHQLAEMRLASLQSIQAEDDEDLLGYDDA